MQQPPEEQPSQSKTFTSWTFLEFIPHVRSTTWYVVAGIVAAAIFAYAIISHNVLFALLVVMIALVMLLNHRKQPKQISITLHEDGIDIAKKTIPWKDITAFWIVYDPPHVKRLYFHTKGMMLGEISIPLENENPVTVRAVLLKYIPEDTKKESETTFDALGRWLKI